VAACWRLLDGVYFLIEAATGFGLWSKLG
jgi:hypothetical protein